MTFFFYYCDVEEMKARTRKPLYFLAEFLPNNVCRSLQFKYCLASGGGKDHCSVEPRDTDRVVFGQTFRTRSRKKALESQPRPIIPPQG